MTISAAEQFIAIREHHPRRMEMERRDDPLHFTAEETLHGLRRLGFGGIVEARPVGQFGLHQHARFVSGLPERLRRCPRVQAHVIEAVALGDGELAAIMLDVPRRIAGLREDAAVDVATQKDRLPIEQNLLALRPRFRAARPAAVQVSTICPADAA